MSIEAAALVALEAGQIPAADLYRAVLADRDRLLSEIAVLSATVANLQDAIALGQKLVGIMEGAE